MKPLFGLQFLRGLAACGVVAYHATDRAGHPFLAGEAGVDLFFVLSGFLMWAITDADSSPGGFLAARAKRIIPSYWIVTSVMLAGALLGLFPAIRLTITHVAASYAFVPAVSPSNGQVWPLLVPGWTLNYEAGFYGLFGIGLCFRRDLQLTVLTLALVGLASVHPMLGSGQKLLYFYTDPHILEFLAGIWLAHIWQGDTLLKASAGPALIALALLFFGIALALPTGWPKAIRFGVPAVVAVAATLAFERRPSGVPDLRILRLLGDASYSIYLWHTLAISVTMKIGVRLGVGEIASIIFNAAAGIGSGMTAYILIERPLITFFRKRRDGHEPLNSISNRGTQRRD